MKFKLIIPALLALLVVGCTRNMDLPEPAEQEGEIVTIRATIPAETRVAYTDSDIPGSGGSLAWQTGDQLLLAGYDGTTYIGSSILTWDSGDAFSGSAIPGATPPPLIKSIIPEISSLWMTMAKYNFPPTSGNKHRTETIRRHISEINCS